MCGGQVIAQRTIVGSTPTVAYLHSDLLGSTGATTNTGGGVTATQRYTPWGSVRAGGALPTTIGFTGQRQDGTGLLYYGARYYDPGIGRFASADDIAPGKEIPQVRNRYSYVTNNPVKYSDPTGHCGTNTRASEYGDEEDAYCQRFSSWLSGWGVTVHDYDRWMAWELGTVFDALFVMSVRLGWGSDGQAFTRAMGGGVDLYRNTTVPWYACAGGSPPGCERDGQVWLSDEIFYKKANPAERTDDGGRLSIVHEFAHRWDEASGGALSERIKGPGAYGYVCGWWSCQERTTDKQGAPSEYAIKGGAVEDFAESVANYIYPANLSTTYQGFIGSRRWNYVACTGAAYGQTSTPDSWAVATTCGQR